MRIIGNLTLILLFLLLLSLLLEIFSAERHYDENSKQMISRKAILQALGISSLALSSECSATRSLIEGLCGCLSDVPGGYCPHNSCDVVTLPRVDSNQSLKVFVIKNPPNQ